VRIASIVVLAFLGAACSSSGGPAADGGTDVTLDGPSDHASADVGTDSSSDATGGMDAGSDAGDDANCLYVPCSTADQPCCGPDSICCLPPIPVEGGPSLTCYSGRACPG
jgi:hypothetical protein